jgi:hypothetical protein
VEENRLKRCLKGTGGGKRHSGGGGFVLLSQVVSHTNICGNSVKTSKKKIAGEKRKRHKFTCTHIAYLETQFEKDLLHTKEGRQNVTTVLTKESGEHFHVEKVNTWVRNHKHKKRGSGGRGSGGS